MSIVEKEIGGYLGLDYYNRQEYYFDLIDVNSGRNALLYLIKAKKIDKIYIPRFLCDSVSKLCERENIKYSEYAIDSSFKPLFDGLLEQDEYLYIVNYYGQLTDHDIIVYKEKWKNIIVDNVHAFFQKPLPGIDTIYSCRKFFGVPDGGYVSTDTLLTAPLTQDISIDRMKHILGRFEKNASDYYHDFQVNDELFYDLELRHMSKLTHNLLKAVDYNLIKQTRNNNYRFLATALSKYNRLNLVNPVGPYCYPFYCETGLEIKKKLAQNKIYVATLWPNMLDLEGTLEQDYAKNILPLPCDQRYTLSDMERMVSCILQQLN